MRSKALFLCSIWLTTAAAPLAASSFEDSFTGATLRLDLYHTGDSREEILAIDAVRAEGAWPGSRTGLIDHSNLGKYLFEIVDLDSQRLLYSRGYASIFGEWETTGAARGGEKRTFPETLRFPEPLRPFQVRLRKRQADQSFREIWTTIIDPGSRFVDRTPVSEHEVWTVFEHGDPATRVDLLFLGDGYTASEMEKFHADVRRLADELFALEPFAGHKTDFNVRAIDTPSRDSGISRPRSRDFRDSALGTTYNALDSERYILTFDERAWRDAAAAAAYDFVVILVNSRQYGGGGIFNLYATAAVDSAFSPYLMVHEFGHSFAGLADEYYTSDVAYEEFYGERVEPWEVNATALNDPQSLKWRDLVAPGTPLPTPWEKERFEEISRGIQERRRELRRQGAPEEQLEELFREERRVLGALLASEEHAGRVGAFEGAAYEATGLYRPSADCIMFTRRPDGFCPVCSRGIERVIELYTR